MHRALTSLKRSPFLRPLHTPTAIRRQHNAEHTWYFQGENSVPDAPTGSQIPSSPQQPPLTRHSRFRRSLFWAATFMTLGWAAQESWKMVKLLHNFELADAEHKEAHLKLVQKLFAISPLVKTIEADPEWVSLQKGANQEPHPFIQHGDPFMSSKAMAGVGGVLSKCYYNRQRGIVIFVVRFAEAMEWAPNTVHPGIVAGWIEDSLDWLGAHISDASTGQMIMASFDGPKRLKVKHTNEQGVPSGAVLCFWIVPALHLGDEGCKMLLAADGEDRVLGKALTRDDLRWTVIGGLQDCRKVPFAPGAEKGATTYARAWVTYGTHGPMPKAAGPSASETTSASDGSSSKVAKAEGASEGGQKPEEVPSSTKGPKTADPTDAEPDSESEPP